MLTGNSRRAVGLALAFALLCAGLAVARPPLSIEMARLIDGEGASAARERFAELWESGSADYEPDVDGLASLGSRYLQEGNIEAGMVVMEMVSVISLAELDSALESQAALVAEMEAPGDEVGQRTSADRGPARGDLERLTGIFAREEASRRELFVTQTCDGFLVVGPLWADTAPWNLRSEGEESFTFRQGALQFALEFATGDDGVAQQLSHNIRGLATPMQRRGPLPGDWPSCQPAAEAR